MNSITNVVTVAYGLDDEPESQFRCPVVVEPRLLKVLQGTTLRVEQLVSEAASAIELVGRFEGASRYVDFAPRIDLPAGEIPIALRVQLIRGRLGKVARIDFSDTARWGHRRRSIGA
ncbi:MAG: hypothetical protein CME59_16290 [Halioglobus sp.]|nr:hypothetical protein [Halioglobus sp.]|tara:strand:+ start:4491 stop:4841 length:351 start_codon:yes stop_codon:yes gene_type:complete